MEGNEFFEELERNLGTEAAVRFVKFYGGSNVYCPKRIQIRWEHQKIREEFKNGASYRELAIKYRYTEMHIRRITKERKK